MIKSIQYFAEADTTRVLVALDLKAAFQNVSRRAIMFSLGQHDPELATDFSRWYTAMRVRSGGRDYITRHPL